MYVCKLSLHTCPCWVVYWIGYTCLANVQKMCFNTIILFQQKFYLLLSKYIYIYIVTQVLFIYFYCYTFFFFFLQDRILLWPNLNVYLLNDLALLGF